MKTKWCLTSLALSSMLMILTSCGNADLSIKTKHLTIEVDGDLYGVTYSVVVRNSQGDFTEKTFSPIIIHRANDPGTGFVTQKFNGSGVSTHFGDGLVLRDHYISSVYFVDSYNRRYQRVPSVYLVPEIFTENDFSPDVKSSLTHWKTSYFLTVFEGLKSRDHDIFNWFQEGLMVIDGDVPNVVEIR